MYILSYIRHYLYNCTYMVFNLLLSVLVHFSYFLSLYTGLPNVPHNIRFTPGAHSINVDWEHADSCFEHLEFIVTYQDPSDHRPMSYPVTATTFNILDLNPDTNYSICIHAVSTLDKEAKSKEKCLYQKTSASKTYIYTHTCVHLCTHPHYYMHPPLILTITSCTSHAPTHFMYVTCPNTPHVHHMPQHTSYTSHAPTHLMYVTCPNTPHVRHMPQHTSCMSHAPTHLMYITCPNTPHIHHMPQHTSCMSHAPTHLMYVTCPNTPHVCHMPQHTSCTSHAPTHLIYITCPNTPHVCHMPQHTSCTSHAPTHLMYVTCPNTPHVHHMPQHTSCTSHAPTHLMYIHHFP